jgi:hypothetical protein
MLYNQVAPSLHFFFTPPTSKMICPYTTVPGMAHAADVALQQPVIAFVQAVRQMQDPASASLPRAPRLGNGVVPKNVSLGDLRSPYPQPSRECDVFPWLGFDLIQAMMNKLDLQVTLLM